MKISTSLSHKFKLIFVIIFLVITITVNIFTVTIIVRNYSSENNSLTSTESTERVTSETNQANNEENDFPAFGFPSKIILSGDRKTVTVTPENEVFTEILELNRKRILFIDSLKTFEPFDENSTNAYYMEYVYETPYSFKLKGIEKQNVNSIIFVLTGKHNGKIKLRTDNEETGVGKLAFDPELLVKVIDHLE